jgi:prepilin-type N-terminal cleavage/methylation domain-containing protein
MGRIMSNQSVSPTSTITRSGFTIVELLIVIVVIGILAAIVIVAYNGVQERARMASAVSFEQSFRAKYMADSTGIWAFNECSGATVGNSSTNVASTDAISGTVSWITSGTPTGQGCALHFDGTTRIETTASLGSTYYAKGAWVRMSSATCSSNNIISQASTNGAVAAFYVPASCAPNAGNNGAWTTVAGQTAINDNKWHYVATTWQNGVQTMYVDGRNVASAVSAAVPTNATGYVSIGAHVGGNFMIGDIANPFVAAQ